MVLRLLLLVSLLMWGACAWAAVPISGRAQEMLFPRAAVQAVAAASYHQRLAYFSALGELDTNPATLARVRKVAARIIAQGILLKPEAADWPWEVHVTSNPDISAFSMAGGKILVGSRFVINTHLSNGELAVLLGHEVAHVIAEHVREQVSLAAKLDPPPPHRQLHVADVINDMESDISVYLRLQPLSRLQELEADDIGIELAARAGTPPQAIKSFYRKIASGDDGQSIFDSHGPSRQREAFVTDMLGYAAAEYRAGAGERLPVYVFR